MEDSAVARSRAMLSKAWSGSSMIEGVLNVPIAVKQELPDDPAELLALMKEPAKFCSWQ